MALTSIAIAANDYSNKGRLLSQQFECRNDYQPEDIPSKASAIRSNSGGLQSDGRPEATADSPSDLASTTSTATTAKESSGPRCLMKKAHIQPSLLTAEAIRKRHQHRGFSFMPGDDFGLPVPPTRPDTQPKESHSRASTPQTATRDGSSERKASNDSFGSKWTANIAPVSGPYPQLPNSVVSLANENRIRGLQSARDPAKASLLPSRRAQAAALPYRTKALWVASVQKAAHRSLRRPRGTTLWQSLLLRGRRQEIGRQSHETVQRWAKTTRKQHTVRWTGTCS